MSRLPYTEDFLAGKSRDQLAEYVAEQRARWPASHPRFNIAKTREADIRSALLNPVNGFSRLAPDISNNTGARCSSTKSLSSLTSNGSCHSDLSHDIGDGQKLERRQEVHVPAAIKPSAPQEICVFLEDTRFTPFRKSVVRVLLDAQTNLRKDDSIFVSASSVVSQLQDSVCGLKGPLKLACPFRFDPSFLDYFGICVDTNMECCTFSSTHIFLPDTHNLRIIVEGIDANAAPKPSNVAHPPVGSTEIVTNTRPWELTQEEAFDIAVAWLKQCASTTKGYTSFEDSHGRVLQNPDIINIWKFVSQFHDRYYHATHPETGRVIQKNMLRAALGLKETSFNDAMDGYRLVKIYGSDGINEDQHVTTELSRIQDTPNGRVALLKFLRDWEKTH